MQRNNNNSNSARHSQRNRRVGTRRSTLPALSAYHIDNSVHPVNKALEQLQFIEGVGPLPNRRVSINILGITQTPASHHLLLSPSDDSRSSSVQTTSVQQLTAIPEEHELNEYSDEQYSTSGAVTSEHETYEQQIIVCDPAPNGGYGWVIVFASFMSNVIVDGIAYTFGMFLQQFVDHFNTSKGIAALVGSLLSGCYLSAGPLVSALVNRFGCRPVSIVGAIIAFIAFLLSTIAPNIGFLMLTYGVMGGIGFGLIYLPAIVSVGYYFTTKRAFATGIAVCGSGVGAFIFAPFCSYLLSIFDWKNTLIILAALALHCAVFGSLMRPLNVVAETVVTNESSNTDSARKPLLQRIAEEKRRRLLSHSNSQFLLLMRDRSEYNDIRSRLLMNTEPGVHSTLYLNELFAQPTQLSPIAERRITVSENSTPTSTHEPTSPISEDNKDIAELDMQLQDSAISLTGELTNQSTTSIAQTPTPEAPTTQLSGRESVHSIGSFRGRRSSALRTVSESSNGASQLALQVIVSSDTHSRRSSRSSTNSQTIFVRPMYKKDIFYSGSTLQLPQNVCLQQMAESRGVMSANMGQSVVSIPARDIIAKVQQQLAEKEQHVSHTSNIASHIHHKDAPQDVVEGELNAEIRDGKCLQFKIPSSMKQTLKEMLDFSLMTQSGAFSLLAVANVFGMMGFYVPFVYLMEFAKSSVKENGEYITQDRAALLISVIGITNTFGRLFFGFLSDKISSTGSIGNIRITALTINNVCCFLCGVVVMMLPFCKTFYTVLFDCVLFGLFGSAYICLTSIILVDLLGLDKLTNAFGLLSLFRGTSSMLGPPIAGIIYDKTESYYIVFATSGSLLVISSLISFLIPNDNREEIVERENV